MALVTYVKGQDVAVADEALHDFMAARGWTPQPAEQVAADPAPVSTGTPPSDPPSGPADAATNTPAEGTDNTPEEKA